MEDSSELNVQLECALGDLVLSPAKRPNIANVAEVHGVPEALLRLRYQEARKSLDLHDCNSKITPLIPKGWTVSHLH